MEYRKLNITIKLEDNDAIQWKLEQTLNEVIGKQNITDLRVLPNCDHIKDNEHFISLSKAEREAKKKKYKFISDNKKK